MSWYYNSVICYQCVVILYNYAVCVNGHYLQNSWYPSSYIEVLHFEFLAFCTSLCVNFYSFVYRNTSSYSSYIVIKCFAKF